MKWKSDDEKLFLNCTDSDVRLGMILHTICLFVIIFDRETLIRTLFHIFYK